MAKTTDKVLLGLLVIALIGMASFMITALPADDISASKTTVNTVRTTQISPEEAKISALEAVPGVIQEWRVDNFNGDFVYEVDILSNGVQKEVMIDAVSGRILLIEVEEEDVPITGTPLERASQAALDYIGEGRVTDSEIGDEEGFYEIEITLNNGGEVDVHLDENFKVLSVEYD